MTSRHGCARVVAPMQPRWARWAPSCSTRRSSSTCYAEAGSDRAAQSASWATFRTHVRDQCRGDVRGLRAGDDRRRGNCSRASGALPGRLGGMASGRVATGLCRSGTDTDAGRLPRSPRLRCPPVGGWRRGTRVTSRWQSSSSSTGPPASSATGRLRLAPAARRASSGGRGHARATMWCQPARTTHGGRLARPRSSP